MIRSTSWIHFVNRFLLRMLLVPSRFYTGVGVNLRHLRSIVEAKLLMDERIPFSLYGGTSGKKTGTWMVMLASLIVGVGLLIPFYFADDLTRLTIFFGVYMVLLSLFLIVDFSHVLVDVRDNTIIQPKPISGATFITARLVYIAIHFSKIVIPMMMPAIIAMLVSRGLWATVIFFLLIMLSTLFTLVLVNLTYLIVIRFFSAERFKSMIATMQIVLSILLFAGYQLVSRSAMELALKDVVISNTPWMWLNPSYWFAQAWKLGYTFKGVPAHLAGAMLSVVVTILGIYSVVKYFAPYFQRKLAMIGQNTATALIQASAKSSVRTSIAGKMAMVFTRNLLTRAGFLFTWRMLSRTREFKMKFYPQVGYIVVIVCIPFVSQIRSMFAGESDIARLTLPLILAIYLIPMLVISATFLAAQGPNFKAGWIFYSTPQHAPGRIVLGSMLASMAKFGLLPLCLLWLCSLVILGSKILPDLLFATTNGVLGCALITYLFRPSIPFTHAPQEDNGAVAVRMFFQFVLLGFVASPHILLHKFPVVMMIGSVIGLALSVLLMRAISRLSWKEMKSFLND